ncbi:MAG: hypothetical protein JWL69_2571 [Phycisphaerales bacterium]|nr:hypothetical protein [Phycisphaerales bacterium]
MNRLRTCVVRPDLFRYRSLGLPVPTHFLVLTGRLKFTGFSLSTATCLKMDNMNHPPCSNFGYQYPTVRRPRQGALFAETVLFECTPRVRHFFSHDPGLEM